jgi:predicted metal-binding membrane protein
MARLVGVTLLATAVFQLTPLKAVCLRHCRSPLTFFMARRGSLSRPGAAMRAGATHGLYCLGCCWALMAVLIVLGGMQLGWALALAAVITAEKLVPWGAPVSRAVAVVALGLGVSLIISPSLLNHLIAMPAMSM